MCSIGALEDKLKKSTKDAPIPAYTWTFEPAVPACGWTDMVAEMLQHIGVQNRQSAEKDKAAKIFCCSHGTPAGIVPHVKGIFPYSIRAQNPRTPPIKGTLKELKDKTERELGRKEKEEKVEKGDLRERRLAAASSSTSRNHHCRAPSKGFVASWEGQQA
ncbi:hypothetical protein V6N12_047628 [Hibiscus sabdariffa]|uniref:Uncharacterized protein n=1 Tax=Hibiscus sabdariffa TaxID=183260 RepID=A0ABR2CVA0_9ROSI